MLPHKMQSYYSSIFSDYIYYKMRSCEGRNELFQGHVNSLENCREICDERSQCISFEWWGVDNSHPSQGSNYCQASSSCTYQYSEEGTRDPVALYVKGNKISQV